MWPLISNGDSITLSSRSFKDLKKGDIILFYHQGFILHRIIKKQKKTYITKGDNNQHPDSFHVTTENYLGVLKKINKKRLPLSFNTWSIKAYQTFFLPLHSFLTLPLKCIQNIRK